MQLNVINPAMRHGSLFSGIGGFDLAAEWMGWENVFHCEWNEFWQRVLHHYWPDAVQLGDITKAKFKRDERGDVWVRMDGIIAYRKVCNDERNIGNEGRRQVSKLGNGDKQETIRNGDEDHDWLNIGPIDIITGGFPCQPYSTAGKRLGKEDERHLWPEMLRVVREVQPGYVVGENVSGLISWNGGMVFDEVQADLEAAGYEVIPFLLPAAGVNAPHRRDRVWFVARRVNAADAELYGHEGWMHTTRSGQATRHFGSCDARNDGCGAWDNFPTQPPVRGRNDGFSTRSFGETFSNNNTMDRDTVIKGALDAGRLIADFETGKIYSTTIRGRNGEKVELLGADCNGYVVHNIYFNGVKKQCRAHQIIWIAANGIYDKSVLMIDHIDRDRKNNTLSNLRLVDAVGNRENATPYGGRLSQEEKDRMFFLYREGDITMSELAEDFGISKSRVQQIISEHSELDGITVSKHRNESIKAYGNAIVPQVALQIFRTIHQYENQ